METLTLQEIQEASQSSRQLAFLRRECSGGLAAALVTLLQEASSSSNVDRLLQILTLLQNLKDDALREEVACSKGFHQCLETIITESNTTSTGDDDGMSIQTLATELQDPVSALDTVVKPPFTQSELQGRLPLVFSMPQDDIQILVHPVTSEEETETHDTGYVMWPASVVLSRWITKNPSIVLESDGDVLELGAGCGLVGLTAASLLQQQEEDQQQEEKVNDETTNVIFTDYNEAVLENLSRNIRLNDLENCGVCGLDFFDQPGNNNNDDDQEEQNHLHWIDLEGTHQPQVSLILAAEVLCYSNDAILVANTLQAALLDGGKAILVSPNNNRRFGVEKFPEACRNIGLEIVVQPIEDGEPVEDAKNGDGIAHELDGYDLVIFFVEKPAVP